MVQGELVTMVQEGGGDVTMLAAPVTLQDSGVKEKPQEEATLQVASHRQLRPIYEDPRANETNDEISDVTDEFEDILVPDEVQHVIPQVPQE